MIEFILVAFCLLCSSFFSAAETALTAVSRARVYKLVAEGNRRAKKVSVIRQRKEDLIGTILLGNNLMNIVATALTTALAIKISGDEGVLYASVVMTALILIFGEVLPKTYAINKPERVSLLVAPVVLFLIGAFKPVTTVVTRIINGILWLFRVDMKSKESLISSADIIRGTIELQHQEGEMVKLERDMLGGILDLAEVKVVDIMVHRKQIEMVDADMPVRDIIRQVTVSTHSRLPFWRDDPDNIIGLLHVRDMFRLMAEHSQERITREMIKAALTEPWFIPETTEIGEQLLEFRRRRRHFAHVVDEYGAFLGIVTLEDILEEIVGEISDEHDRPSAMKLKQQADGSYLVEGTTMIRDLNRELDWNLPDEDASTLAGLVIHEARRIPEVGAVFAFFGYRFGIIEKRANQILKLKVRKLEELEEDGEGA